MSQHRICRLKRSAQNQSLTGRSGKKSLLWTRAIRQRNGEGFTCAACCFPCLIAARGGRGGQKSGQQFLSVIAGSIRLQDSAERPWLGYIMINMIASANSIFVLHNYRRLCSLHWWPWIYIDWLDNFPINQQILYFTRGSISTFALRKKKAAH